MTDELLTRGYIGADDPEGGGLATRGYTRGFTTEAPPTPAVVGAGFGAVFFPTGTYTVTRTARGTVTLGRYAPGSTATFLIVANVQDVSGDQLRDLPEGIRSEDSRMLFTTTRLIPQSPTTDPDVVSIDGEDWRVVRVYTARVFARRYRALVQRIRP